VAVSLLLPLRLAFGPTGARTRLPRPPPALRGIADGREVDVEVEHLQVLDHGTSGGLTKDSEEVHDTSGSYVTL
jgi:hypothetical protein